MEAYKISEGVEFCGHPGRRCRALIMAGNKIAKKTKEGNIPPAGPPSVSKPDPQNLISFKIMEQICFHG